MMCREMVPLAGRYVDSCHNRPESLTQQRLTTYLQFPLELGAWTCTKPPKQSKAVPIPYAD